LLDNIKYFKLVIEPSEGGIVPCNLFELRIHISNLLNPPICGGIVPVNELAFKLRNVNVDDKLNIELGIMPFSLFADRSKETSLLNMTICVGIDPARQLLLRASIVKARLLPIDVGIVPFILLKLICKSIRLLDALK
jgi:hypothetical protein